MFSLSPLTFYAPAVPAIDLAIDLENVPASPNPESFAPTDRNRAPSAACPLHPQTSYWLSDANEMVPIKTFLIIVNSFVA
jgi:hypothetical protein